MTFDDLYSNFSRDQELARLVISPNTEDEDHVKLAIVGFSYNSATEDWTISEYRFLTQILSNLVNLTKGEKMFYALSIGYVLGLCCASKCDGNQLRMFLDQLHGYVLLKGGAF